MGFDAARGDMLTVQDLSFDGNRAPAPAPMVQQLLATAEGSPMLIKYGALVAGLLIGEVEARRFIDQVLFPEVPAESMLA